MYRTVISVRGENKGTFVTLMMKKIKRKKKQKNDVYPGAFQIQ